MEATGREAARVRSEATLFSSMSPTALSPPSMVQPQPQPRCRLRGTRCRRFTVALAPAPAARPPPRRGQPGRATTRARPSRLARGRGRLPCCQTPPSSPAAAAVTTTTPRRQRCLPPAGGPSPRSPRPKKPRATRTRSSRWTYSPRVSASEVMVMSRAARMQTGLEILPEDAAVIALGAAAAALFPVGPAACRRRTRRPLPRHRSGALPAAWVRVPGVALGPGREVTGGRSAAL